MRLWIAFVVLASLAFSVGGVAYRPLAAEPDSEDARLVEAAAAAGSRPGRCEVPRGPASIAIDLSALPHRSNFVSLNTEGFNYRPEGINAHQRVAPVDQSVPAAPARP